jgi:hypothetical protein
VTSSSGHAAGFFNVRKLFRTVVRSFVQLAILLPWELLKVLDRVKSTMRCTTVRSTYWEVLR